jgi:hypothetical protein
MNDPTEAILESQYVNGDKTFLDTYIHTLGIIQQRKET